jgi:hypothetical protein
VLSNERVLGIFAITLSDAILGKRDRFFTTWRPRIQLNNA